KESIKKTEGSTTSQKEKEQLKERMDEQLQELAKNQELLDKLEELQSKISNEELVKEIEEYKQEKKIQEKNLNQLLELTKRFYVSEKNKKLAADLMELGKKQEELSEKDGEEVKAEQEKLQEQFDRFKEDRKSVV